MIIVEKAAELSIIIKASQGEGKSVGFVPTMGALHQGHMSLVNECRANNELCVVSIFVNPTQFNNASDLEHYPRTMQEDCAMLEKEHVDIVFAPTVSEIYPKEDNRQFDFGTLDKVMEGEHRPGHFNGVAQVVHRLFEIVTPDNSYFGEKDFQQLAIINAMVKQMQLKVNIIPCAIVREDDGLAMSSRNTRLSAEHRAIAPSIYKALQKSKEMSSTYSLEEVKQAVIDEINATSLLEVEYFDIASTQSLESCKSWDDQNSKVGCIAVFAGEVRLIDNITY